MQVPLLHVLPRFPILGEDDCLDVGADQLLQDGCVEIGPVILVARQDRVIEHHEASPLVQGAGDEESESQTVKLGLAEHGDDIAQLRGASVGVKRQAGFEVHGAPRAFAGSDGRKEGRLVGAE